MDSSLRVALFTDSFCEANGVATLSQNLVDFAKKEQLPFLCVFGGRETRFTQDGSCGTIELKRSFASFPLDRELYCDPLLTLHRNFVVEQIRAFQPDLIHITGPGDVGILGALVAHILHVPWTASWHTNLHEYVARRLEQVLAGGPRKVRTQITKLTESQCLRALLRFYRLPLFTLAPNQATVDMLGVSTGRPSYLMLHGVDLQRFSPNKCPPSEQPFCLGYVGRLTPEKNVRYFSELERKLVAAGESNFRILLVGEGSEGHWLSRNLRTVEMPGVLKGDKLAAAYASLDAFVFPSRTDTFGLVLLEAMASGVPIVTSPEVGARLGIRNAEGGYLAEDFTESILTLMRDPLLRQRMGLAARRFACSKDWQDVFRRLYLTYEAGLIAASSSRTVRA